MDLDKRSIDGSERSVNSDDMFSRSDKEDRLGFIRKVYGILSVQLCLTAGGITAVKLVPGWNESVQTPAMMGLAYGCIFIALIIQCAIFCCKSVARTTPTNYICLFAFTLCETFILSVICSQYPGEVVLSAAGMTAVVTVALTFYACTTKTDFTMCGGFFFLLCIVMIMLICISFFMSWVSWWHPVLSGFLILCYGLFLIYDTQLIAGGKKYELGYDDYIIGSLLLYVDIIMLFLELLRLFGGRN